MRNNFMGRVVAICCLLGSTVAVQAQKNMGWAKSYEAAQTQAQQDHKLIMVDLYADWCVRCKELDAKTYSDPKVIEAANDFVPVSLNAEKEGRKLAARFNLHGYPTILFLEPGADDKKQPTLVGSIQYYLPPAAFLGRLTLIKQSYRDFPQWEAQYKANPKDVETIGKLVPVYYMRLAGKRAASLLAEGMQLDPDNAQGHLTQAYNVIADQYQAAQQCDKAIALYTKAAQTGRSPQDICYADFNIALCDAQQNRFTQAIALLDTIVEMPEASQEDKVEARNTRTQFLELMAKSKTKNR